MSEMSGPEVYSIARVGEGRFGKKMMAAIGFPENAGIMRFTGKSVNFGQTKSLPDESFALQVGCDRYLYLDIPFRFINHSCDPSCGLTPDLQLIALRNIRKGEELTYDYSTTMLEKSWTMECNCGSQKCRRVIADFVTLSPEIQKYYLSRNVVQSFIIKAISFNGKQ